MLRHRHEATWCQSSSHWTEGERSHKDLKKQTELGERICPGRIKGERRMYYRVAIQVDPSPTWQWKSTALSSLNLVLQWLQFYRAFPQERLRIFSSSSREALSEQLVRENQGFSSTSVPATQFLQARGITPRGAVGEACAGGARAHDQTAFLPAKTSPSPDERGMSPLDKRREELERGAGGDHDLPYRFTLPTSMPQVLAWVKLLARVQQGDFQPEVIACGSGNTSACVLLDPPYFLLHRLGRTWHDASSQLQGVSHEHLPL
jgi:hypothetical protein